MTPQEELIKRIKKNFTKWNVWEIEDPLNPGKKAGVIDIKEVVNKIDQSIFTIKSFLKDKVITEKAYLECLEADSKDLGRIQRDYKLVKKGDKVVILDNNPLSLACYAEEYPENWKKICEAVAKKKSQRKGD